MVRVVVVVVLVVVVVVVVVREKFVRPLDDLVAQSGINNLGRSDLKIIRILTQKSFFL